MWMPLRRITPVSSDTPSGPRLVPGDCGLASEKAAKDPLQQTGRLNELFDLEPCVASSVVVSIDRSWPNPSGACAQDPGIPADVASCGDR